MTDFKSQVLKNPSLQSDMSLLRPTDCDSLIYDALLVDITDVCGQGINEFYLDLV